MSELTRVFVRLKLSDPDDLGTVVRDLEDRLNEGHEPTVTVSTEDDVVCCQAVTWEPLLQARIEEAGALVLGSAWIQTLMWT